MIKKCYCGLQAEYIDCCGRFINGTEIPEIPELLMRSRYSAYAQGLVDYIALTMSGKALDGFDKISSKQWAESVTWLGLKVINTYNESTQHGFVEFSAKFMQKKQQITRNPRIK